MSSAIGAFRLKIVWLLLALAATLLFAAPANAALTFELRTGNNAIKTQKLRVDSNKCATEGPRAAYVGGVITNTGSSDVININGTISGLNTNIFLAGGQPASQFVGTLAPGQSIMINWLVGMACNIGATASPTVQFTSSTTTSNTALTLNIVSAISANAGGQVIGSLLGPGAVVGQTIYFDANYDFGGTGTGDEFILQPTGSQLFNAACFRLVGSVVTASNVNAAPVGLTNRLYVVQPNDQPGNNYFISIRYYFEYQCAGASTTARPYAAQTSGTKIKYTGNYDGTGSVQVSFPGATNPFTIEKTVSETGAFVGTAGNLTYTIKVTNPSTNSSIMSRFVDVLPSGMTYVGLTASSGVTVANSSSLPSNGATGTLNFVGRLGQSYALPAGGSITLQYTATRPATTGTFTNSVQGVFGSATTPVATATYQQTEIVPLSVSKVSSVISDPVSTTNGPFNIPGALVEYLIVVGNPNIASIDADSVAVTDIAPPEAKFCLADLSGGGSGPVTFTDGATTSDLGYNFDSLTSLTDDLEFSDDGTDWTYEPQADVDNCDEDINYFRVKPTGEFAPSSSFSLKVQFRLQ